MKAIKRETAEYLLINLVAFVLILIIDSMFPLCLDDLMYSGGTHTNDPGIAFSLSLEKIMNFYRVWSGRIVGNFFAFYMTILNKRVYDICNAIIYVILCNLIYQFIDAEERSPMLLLWIYLGMWLFAPEYGMIFIWSNASTIYHWPMVPLLGFALVYYRTVTDLSNHLHTGKGQSFEKAGLTKNTIRCAAMLVLGLLAGNSFEPAAATMLAAGFLWLCLCIYSKRGVKCHEISGIIGFFVGFLVMVLSPGNASRSAAIRVGLPEQNLFVTIAFRLARETYYTCRFMAIPFGLSIVLWIAAGFMAMREVRDPHGTERDSSSSTWFRIRQFILRRWREPFFICCALISIYSMTFSIAFANRIFITPTILLVISMGISIHDIAAALSQAENRSVRSGWKITAGVLLVVLCVFVLTEYLTAIIEMAQNGLPFIKTTMFTEYNNNLFK